MDLKLQGKVIIVTGGAKGIGFGISQLLAEEGAIAAIVGRDRKDLQMAVDDIAGHGGQAAYFTAELTDESACKKVVSQILEQYGQIDGLVNNAGVNDGIGLEHGNYPDFMRSIERNVGHYFMMAHYALPALKKSRGSIVNIGSKTSFTGQGGTSGYVAANGARNALTREWAVELLPFQIRVNAVIVAECETPQYDKWLKTFDDPAQKLREITDRIPLEHRMTTPREIASTVAFLLSEVSSHTTGQLLFVDGGYTHLDRSLS